MRLVPTSAVSLGCAPRWGRTRALAFVVCLPRVATGDCPSGSLLE